MASRDGIEAGGGRVEREIARERHERALHDEARAGLSALEEEFRIKDARERADTGMLKRHPGR
ncbi:hypothetical protein LK542_11720 [Massilia sp. IC2-477]|uniref:hypothetical protein n=1 Tax=unclassified Massilia TaxID=2609279 RepID=UPI001D12550D|nr:MULTISPECIES: hypothetical protein [unclassified Massilia]MCC2956284.1 hypothetical protein [Massilia sp. IC2-477]MCC2972346.1 hypothetical protein [Massilia sp. IC2-476]